MPDRVRHGRTLAALLVSSLVCLVPFAAGLLQGRSFYFRDMASIHIPFREAAASGLAHGQFRYWNPLDHEGVPFPYPPLSYPVDALQALLPWPFGFTLLLALHLPLAAVALFLLARSLGASRGAALGGGLVYALGGFCSSSIGLYMYGEAAAWTPLVVLAMRHVARGGRLCWAALAVAVLASTMAVEFLLQALVIGFVLSLAGGDGPPTDDQASRSRRDVTTWRLGRMSVAAGIGIALAAPTLLVMRAVLRESARGAGFSADVTLAHSVHPFTLLQVLVANLHGDLANPVDRWWGENFFPRGFPYFVSLYLGATVLALAFVGLRHGRGPRRRLALLVLFATIVCLGHYLGLRTLVQALPVLGAVRYPAKAFLTAQIGVALLTALGWDAGSSAGSRAWRTLASAALGLGALLVFVPALLICLLPAATRWFQGAFFPSAMTAAARDSALGLMRSDAALGGGIALCASALALAAAVGWTRAGLARVLLLALVAVDLLRAGSGLNPMTDSSFFRLSPEMRPVAQEIRASGRAFVCSVEAQNLYWYARAQRGSRHGLWTFALLLETLSPHLNMLSGVPTAYTEDLTSLVPLGAFPDDASRSCTRIEAIVPRLRAAAVTHVIALDPIDAPSLSLARLVRPARVAPVTIRVYRVLDPLPRFSIADGRVLAAEDAGDRLRLRVEAERASVLLVRDTWAAGWTARIDGRPADIVRDGLHRAVAVPAGQSTVTLSYEPPGLRTGLLIAVLAALALVAVEIGRSRRRRRGSSSK